MLPLVDGEFFFREIVTIRLAAFDVRAEDVLGTADDDGVCYVESLYGEKRTILATAGDAENLVPGFLKCVG